MAVLPIYNCYHPVLKKKTQKVEKFDDELKQTVTDMFDTMYGTGNGIGLAANQVGIEKSIIVIDINHDDAPEKYEPLVLVNPVITKFSDEIIEDREGCLSVPELYEKVPRSKSIEVLYYDADGNKQENTFEDLLARVVQHEIDHLNGILFFERISPIKRTLAKSKLKKIERGQTLPDYDMILPNGQLARAKDES